MAQTVSGVAHRIDSRLRQLLGEERNTQVDFLLELEKFDATGGFAAFEYGNLWQYLQRELGLLECAIYRRVHAMKLLRKFPQVEAYLRDGRLWMSSLVKLEEVLTSENVDEMLAKASGKSFRDVEVLVASLRAPVPDKNALVRRVPVPSASPLDFNNGGASPAADGGKTSQIVLVDANVPDLGVGTAGNDALRRAPVSDSDARGEGGPKDDLFTSKEDSRARRARVVPIAPDRYDVSIRVRGSFVEKLEKLKKIFGHAIPDGNVEAMLTRAMDRAIAEHAKKSAPKRSRAARAESKGSSALGIEESPSKSDSPQASDVEFDSRRARPKREPIPAAVEREVRQRDGDRCQWPLPDGNTCGSEHQVEIEHKISVAKRGKSTLENLWQTCRAHNLLKARREFGDAFMAKFPKNDGTRSNFSREK